MATLGLIRTVLVAQTTIRTSVPAVFRPLPGVLYWSPTTLLPVLPVENFTRYRTVQFARTASSSQPNSTAPRVPSMDAKRVLSKGVWSALTTTLDTKVAAF